MSLVMFNFGSELYLYHEEIFLDVICLRSAPDLSPCSTWPSVERSSLFELGGCLHIPDVTWTPLDAASKMSCEYHVCS